MKTPPSTSLCWTNPSSPNLSLHAFCCSALILSVTLCWTKFSSSDPLFLWGDQKQTQCSGCCLLSATQIAMITAAVCTFLNVVNLHHHKDTLLTYIQLAVQRESRSFFTKLLPTLLSQVLSFAELHEASARPLLRLEFQLLPLVCGLLQTWMGIPTHPPGCSWIHCGASALAADYCGTPLVNWLPVTVDLDSELLTLPFGPKGPPSFSPRHLYHDQIICLPFKKTR